MTIAESSSEDGAKENTTVLGDSLVLTRPGSPDVAHLVANAVARGWLQQPDCKAGVQVTISQ